MTEIAVFGAVWALVWRLAAHTTVGAIGLIALVGVTRVDVHPVARARPIRAAVGPLEEGGEMSALAGLAGLLPPSRIGVLSPHKKGSLTTEMLISATLPIGPMPLAAPAFSGLWIGHPYISGQMNFLSRYCGGSVGGRIAGQINRCLRQGRAENPLMGDYCPNGFRPPAAPIVGKQEIEPGALRSRHLSSCPINRTLRALSVRSSPTYHIILNISASWGLNATPRQSQNCEESSLWRRGAG